MTSRWVWVSLSCQSRSGERASARLALDPIAGDERMEVEALRMLSPLLDGSLDGALAIGWGEEGLTRVDALDSL